MGRSSARAAYIALVGLHPRNFREAFATEMVDTFDEAAQDYGAGWLVRDAALSVLRQRLLRKSDAEYEAAVCGGVGLRSGVYPLIGPVEFLSCKLLLASVLTSLLFQVIRPL